MFPALAIHRSGWKDLFIARELHRYPTGADRALLLVVKAAASCLGTVLMSLGPLTSLIVKSQGIGVDGYGYLVAAVGMVGALIALISANWSDKFSRIRLLLWGMIPSIALLFVLASTPDGSPVMFVVVYTMVGWTEAFAIVTVSALLRDLSPRTGRALGVGLVTVGTIVGNWVTAWLAGAFLDDVGGTWQGMLLVYCWLCVGLWVVVWLFGREPSAGIRAQIMPSTAAREAVEANAKVLEREGVETIGFWAFIRLDWRLWLLATAQGLFLLGYITFVHYGPLLTELGFGQDAQTASATTSWVFLSIIVFLLVGGYISDKLRIRKAMGFAFTTLSGFALLGLGLASGQQLSSGTVTVIYVIVGAMLAMMWSPTNALFSETAEDIHATRQTTAFGGQHVVNRAIYQAWIFILPLVLVATGVDVVWYVAAAGAFLAAPVMMVCRGTWGRFQVGEVTILEEAKPLVEEEGAPRSGAATKEVAGGS